LFVLYFGMMSMITPPIALAAFAAAAIAKAPAMATGWAAVRFGWLAYLIPLLFVFSPTLLLIGETTEIAVAVLTAVFGVWFVSIAMAGFLVRPFGLLRRLVFAAAGLLSLIPASAFPAASQTDIIGILLGLLLVGYEFFRARQQKEST